MYCWNFTSLYNLVTSKAPKNELHLLSLNELLTVVASKVTQVVENSTKCKKIVSASKGIFNKDSNKRLTSDKSHNRKLNLCQREEYSSLQSGCLYFSAYVCRKSCKYTWYTMGPASSFNPALQLHNYYKPNYFFTWTFSVTHLPFGMS